jgi:Putative Actinobacterial Holin-X, holin superfamily III
MQDAPAPSPEVEILPENLGLAALLGQLGNDAGDFARAEAAYLKAQVGERASYALPAIAMIGAGISLLSGVLIALLVGLMMILAPLIGTGLSVLAVTLGAALLAAGLLRFGTKRIKATLKRPEER